MDDNRRTPNAQPDPLRPHGLPAHLELTRDCVMSRMLPQNRWRSRENLTAAWQNRNSAIGRPGWTSQRDWLITEQVLQDGRTYADVANEFHLSRARVEQIVVRTVKRHAQFCKLLEDALTRGDVIKVAWSLHLRGRRRLRSDLFCRLRQSR